MKKTLGRLLCLLLALLMLTGCALNRHEADKLTGAFAQETGSKDIIRYSSLDGYSKIQPLSFDEIEYVRPDLSILKAHISAVELALANNRSIKSIMEHLDACYEEYSNYNTMHTVADIRACKDRSDGFYAAELNWCEDNFSVLDELFDGLYRLCANSKQARQLERNYFWDGFVEEYSGASDTPLYSEEEKRLMRLENSLINRYRQLIANPCIEINGQEYILDEYIMDCSDDEYYAAMTEYYLEYNPLLAEIYIELVSVRNQLARERGFESYEQMQYQYYFSRDYSAEDAAGYVADIKKYMVPLYRQIMQSNPYDELDYDYLSNSRLHEIIGSAAEKIGGDVAEAYDFMSRYGYCDTAMDLRKAPMSFQSYLDKYEAPFLFLDSNGDLTDILSFSHEFGHYADAYVNYNAYETVDLSECFSQAMEYLMLGCYGDVLSREEQEALLRIKLLDTLEMYIQQASFVEFENEVFSASPDELSPEYLNELSLRLAEEYGYCSEDAEEYYAMSWIDIVHFFEMPFYVVSYPVSNDIAMQIYELEQQESGLGIKKYLEMLPREYSGFMDTVESAGLESPFAPGRIQQVAETMRKLLLE